ncbi:28S ribosomal protein S17, mitochondrial [Arapaima gigas]
MANRLTLSRITMVRSLSRSHGESWGAMGGHGESRGVMVYKATCTSLFQAAVTGHPRGSIFFSHLLCRSRRNAMSVKTATVHATWIIGRVIGTKMQKTAKVRVTRLVLDRYLLKYYNKRKTYFAHDPLERCSVGDIVLLKALPERRTRHVRHELVEIVHKLGNVVDPLTGKRVAGSVFLDPITDSTEPAQVLAENLAKMDLKDSEAEKH